MLLRRSWSRRARRGPCGPDRPREGVARRDRHDPEGGILVTTDGVDGWLEGNLANMPFPPVPSTKATPERASLEEE